VISITISIAAFEAIAATMPFDVGYEKRETDEFIIWLEPRVLDRLRPAPRRRERLRRDLAPRRDRGGQSGAKLADSELTGRTGSVWIACRANPSRERRSQRFIAIAENTVHSPTLARVRIGSGERPLAVAIESRARRIHCALRRRA
jgi:hypothetical protein